MSFPTNIPQDVVLGKKFYENNHPEYGMSYGWNLTHDGVEKVMFIKTALHQKIEKFDEGTHLRIVYSEKKRDDGKSYHEWELLPPSNGNGHHVEKPTLSTEPSPAAVPAAREQIPYAVHLLGCADLAMLICKQLGIIDAAAMQACFATVCIDAKSRGLLVQRQNPAPVPPDYDDDPVPF